MSYPYSIAASTAPVTAGGGGDEGIAILQRISYAGLLAGLVSFGVAQILLLLVEQVELLLVLTALGAVLMYGLGRAWRKFALRDRRLDRCEAFVSDIFSFLQIILFFCAGQYIIRICTNLLVLNNQQLTWICLMIGYLIFFGLAFLPYLSGIIFNTQTPTPNLNIMHALNHFAQNRLMVVP